MISSYFNITVIEEWCTFIAAIFLLNKRTGIWQLFILLFFLILCAETIGWYMHTVAKKNANALPFNILLLLSDSFFIWLFSKAQSLKKSKSTLKYVLVFFIAFALINLFFFEGMWSYNAFTDTIGDIVLIVISCYFIFSILNNDEYVDLLKHDYFWLAIGLLFYSLGSILVYHFPRALTDFAKQTKIDIGTYINYAINLILYISLIIAFVCRRKTTKLLQVL